MRGIDDIQAGLRTIHNPHGEVARTVHYHAAHTLSDGNEIVANTVDIATDFIGPSFATSALTKTGQISKAVANTNRATQYLLTKGAQFKQAAANLHAKVLDRVADSVRNPTLGMFFGISGNSYKVPTKITGDNMMDVLSDWAKSAHNPTRAPIRGADDIALGIRSQHGGMLEEFSEQVGAANMHRWKELGLYDDGVNGWGRAFMQTMNRTKAKGGRAHFDLTSLDIAKAKAGNPASWQDSYTAFELRTILRRKDWFEITDFYRNGTKLTPQELIELGIVPHKFK